MVSAELRNNKLLILSAPEWRERKRPAAYGRGSRLKRVASGSLCGCPPCAHASSDGGPARSRHPALTPVQYPWEYPGWFGTVYEREREYRGKFALTRFNQEVAGLRDALARLLNARPHLIISIPFYPKFVLHAGANVVRHVARS